MSKKDELTAREQLRLINHRFEVFRLENRLATHNKTMFSDDSAKEENKFFETYQKLYKWLCSYEQSHRDETKTDEELRSSLPEVRNQAEQDIGQATADTYVDGYNVAEGLAQMVTYLEVYQDNPVPHSKRRELAEILHEIAEFVDTRGLPLDPQTVPKINSMLQTPEEGRPR